MEKEERYWTDRYQDQNTGWDIGQPSTPLKEYIDQVTDPAIAILIPGAGNGYEAEYLWKKGFKNITILDISKVPLQGFQKRNPEFPKTQLLHEDFFLHQGSYDLILEQTFFCSFPPTDENRNRYAKQMSNLLVPSGKLVGLWFNFPLTESMEKRPFGGTKAMYIAHLAPYFTIQTFKNCYNSIAPRQGNELFGIFFKK